ncbi:Hypothetical predicted protein [Pelobates cultripes]|uniref:Uncharacterized protein n=1 Tax=Pelobates cultripes TaxID=61616 RepID=A0AAD1W4D1_PELCU|nr:Hypothetical predicted protein [Pelobates cultripes]
MRSLTRLLVMALATALLTSMVTAQEEPVTQSDFTPSVDSSIAENEESTEPPQETEPVTETTNPPPEDPVSLHVGQRSQTEGIAGSASSNSESSNSENNDSFNVETMQAGTGLDLPAGSLESKENVDPESEESFTLPAGK